MSSTGYDLDPVLRTVARTTAACLGFGTAVTNLYRPAWDDFHTVMVEGSDEANRLLLGQSSTAEDWALLLDDRYERRGAYVLHDFDWSQDRMATYVPPIAASTDPDAWHPDDALFVPLRSSAGEVLGILSVDEPTSRKRPTDEELDLLVAVAAHAALALEHVQQAAAAGGPGTTTSCSSRCATARAGSRAPCGPTTRPTACSRPTRCCGRCARSPTTR